MLGVNKGNVEIKMTRPVTNKITEIEDDKFESELCFWTGSPWKGKKLPEPIDSRKIYVQKRPKMVVYVR